MKNTIKVNDEDWIEVNHADYISANNRMELGGKFYIPKPKEKTAIEIYMESNYHSVYRTEKLRSIAIILAVADYLNDGKGKPEHTWFEFLLDSRISDRAVVLYVGHQKFGFVSFHPDVIDKAKELLGEEIIKRALS